MKFNLPAKTKIVSINIKDINKVHTSIDLAKKLQ